MSSIYGKEYSDIYELTLDFSARWRLFSSLFISHDPEILDFIRAEDQEKYHEIMSLPITEDRPDEYLFRIDAILNPHGPIHYHSYQFSDYKDIGKKIIKFAPKIDVYLMDLFKNKLVLDHMERNDFNKTAPDVYNKVSELVEFAAKQPKIAYFRFGFYFNGTANIKYNGVVYPNYQTFVGSLYGKENLIDLADSLIDDGFIMAWQISSAQGNLSIYDRYCHILKICDEKKVLLEKEKRKEKRLK